MSDAAHTAISTTVPMRPYRGCRPASASTGRSTCTASHEGSAPTGTANDPLCALTVMAVAVPLDCHGQLQALVLAWVVTIVTMLRPEVRYARADDCVAIAYS